MICVIPGYTKPAIILIFIHIKNCKKTSLLEMCCFWKELPYGSINDTKFRNLLHGEAIVSPNPKIISSIIKQSEYFDEEILKRANNGFYTPDEFKTALKSFNLASQLFCMYLNISSLSYHHLELYNLLSNLKIKPNILEYLKLAFKGGSNQ